MSKQDLINKVNEALEIMRPFLQQDGGDVELVDIDPELNVSLKLLGNCQACSMSPMTMKAGIEEAIKKVAPEIKSVIAINV